VRIQDLFDGLDRAYGTYQILEKDGEKLQGQGKTVQQPLTDDIWELHLSGERSLGVIPIRDDNTIVFAAIDIDTYPLDLIALEAQVKKLGLPLVVTRSKSGGAHLWLFIKVPGALSEAVRPKLAEWAAELGHAGVEIFPKQDEIRNKEDVGNWINMPYFGGDNDKLRYAIINGKPSSMSKFLLEAQKLAITHDELELVEIIDSQAVSLDGGPPCLNTLFRNGFPSGSRNISLFNVGVYCKKRYEDDWQDKLDEFNEVLFEPALSPGEVAQIKRNLDKKTYFYKCSDKPICDVCQKDICKTKPYGIGDDGPLTSDMVKIEGSIRVETEDMYYIATVNGKRVHLDHHAMCGQHAFRLSVMKQTGFMVPNMKPRAFTQIILNITEKAQVVEAPKRTGRKGSIINEFLYMASSTNIAENWTQCMSGLPMPDDKGGVYVYPHKMIVTLRRRLQQRTLEPQTLFEVLTSEGISIVDKKIGGRVFWYLEDLQLLTDETPEEDL